MTIGLLLVIFLFGPAIALMLIAKEISPRLLAFIALALIAIAALIYLGVFNQAPAPATNHLSLRIILGFTWGAWLLTISSFAIHLRRLSPQRNWRRKIQIGVMVGATLPWFALLFSNWLEA